MEINADFTASALVHTAALDWVPSPMAGVDRRMLDRIGGEVARATSIVRYAKGSAFPEHTHSGGEEFIVLEGVFQDEHGDYPAGTYVRNPVGTHHVPGSEPGCTIFVKLWQFDPDDQEQLSIDLNTAELASDPDRPGISASVLAGRDYEHVSLERWEPNTRSVTMALGGFEVLVLSGTLTFASDTYTAHDWLRIPHGEAVDFKSGPDGARLWIKRGHLRDTRVPDAA
ncbi:MAG: cupin domain-containing protein [Pseudomonadota bacterium]